jgi:pSer/pThr/pTyr-binding forkhead associated (FHA) protein/ribosomal protein L37E
LSGQVGHNARLPMETCSRCGAKLSADSKYCAICGAPRAAAPAPARTAARPRVTLRIVRADGGPEALVPMQGDQLICGRHGDLVIPDDPFVADAQARFFFASGRLAVEDVGGGNGVFLRLRHEREIPQGGELRIGRQRLLLEAIPPPAVGPDGAVMWGSPDPGVRAAAFPLKEGANAVGRELGDITFPGDGFVSGRHAELLVRGERVTVKDLGSSNGTFFRLGAPALVDDGDQFLIGRELLRVEVKP